MSLFEANNELARCVGTTSFTSSTEHRVGENPFNAVGE